ncbi:G-protein coupled receptor 55 [Xyrauchen texanus]|uniref:G-protein coupled receptor 55 n=1 Tax=Xyrauchen texanus TaxID=154827 RepID=UPI0022425A23|nr:G-protein coupled receptor 55 [Xyrauchen texanus]
MLEFNCSAATDTVFLRVVYPPVFIVSLVFNITALCIFCRIKHKHLTDMHIYMLNLLVADFLAIFFLPFRIFEAFCPLKTTGFCTFLLCTQYSNMYGSIFTITAISIHRFIAIRFPFLIKAMVAKLRYRV